MSINHIKLEFLHKNFPDEWKAVEKKLNKKSLSQHLRYIPNITCAIKSDKLYCITIKELFIFDSNIQETEEWNNLIKKYKQNFGHIDDDCYVTNNN